MGCGASSTGEVTPAPKQEAGNVEEAETKATVQDAPPQATIEAEEQATIQAEPPATTEGDKASIASLSSTDPSHRKITCPTSAVTDLSVGGTAVMFGEWMGGNELPCNLFAHMGDGGMVFAVNDGPHTKMVRFSDKACRAATTNGMKLTAESVTSAWNSCEIDVPVGMYQLKNVQLPSDLEEEDDDQTPEFMHCFQDIPDLSLVHFEGPPGSTITVRSATYHNIDFTKEIQELVDGNLLHIEGGVHTVLGDPAPGVPKLFNASLCVTLPGSSSLDDASPFPVAAAVATATSDISENIDTSATSWVRVFCRKDGRGFMEYTQTTIKTMASTASDILIRDTDRPGFCVNLLPGQTWPLKSLAAGYAFSGFEGEPADANLVSQTWTGPATEHMIVGRCEDHHMDGFLYHASCNHNGLHLRDSGDCGFQYKQSHAIEVWLGFADSDALAAAVAADPAVKQDELDREAARNGIALVHLPELDAACLASTDPNPVDGSENSNETQKWHPALGCAFLARDPKTQMLQVYHGVGGVRRKPGVHDEMLTKSDGDKQWRRIFNGADYDLEPADIAKLAATATRVQICDDQGHSVTSTAEWPLENLRKGLSMSVNGCDEALAEASWEGNMVANMVGKGTPDESLSEFLYHAAANGKGLHLKSNWGNSNWVWGKPHSGSGIEVWLDSTAEIATAANRDTGVSVTPDDIFCWCSCSKSLGATLAAIIVSEGCLSWQSTVATVYADDDEILSTMNEWHHHLTVEMFLSMTAGLPDWSAIGEAICEVGNEASYKTAIQDWLKRFVKVAPDPQRIGKKFYNSAGCCIVAALLEKVTGKDWMALCKEKIWDKILCPDGAGNDLNRYAFHMHGFRDNLRDQYCSGKPEVVWGHRFGGRPTPLAAYGRDRIQDGLLGPLAGSMSSTMAVFGRYMAIHASFAFANEATGMKFVDWNRLHTPLVGECNGIAVDSGSYCMCLIVAGPKGSVTHNGSTGDFKSHMQMHPSRADLGYCTMSNGGTRGNIFNADLAEVRRKVAAGELNS